MDATKAGTDLSTLYFGSRSSVEPIGGMHIYLTKLSLTQNSQLPLLLLSFEVRGLPFRHVPEKLYNFDNTAFDNKVKHFDFEFWSNHSSPFEKLAKLDFTVLLKSKCTHVSISLEGKSG